MPMSFLFREGDDIDRTRTILSKEQSAFTLVEHASLGAMATFAQDCKGSWKTVLTDPAV